MQTHSTIRGRLLQKQEAANYSDASVSWIDRLIRSGDIKAIRISTKMTRVIGDSLADYLDSKSGAPSIPRGKAIKSGCQHDPR
jgi:hypothetical protein